MLNEVFLDSMKSGIGNDLHNIFEWYELSYFKAGANQELVDAAYVKAFSWIYGSEINAMELHDIVLTYYRRRAWVSAEKFTNYWSK